MEQSGTKMCHGAGFDINSSPCGTFYFPTFVILSIIVSFTSRFCLYAFFRSHLCFVSFSLLCFISFYVLFQSRFAFMLFMLPLCFLAYALPFSLSKNFMLRISALGRWNGPLNSDPFRVFETEPSLWRYPNHSPYSLSAK